MRPIPSRALRFFSCSLAVLALGASPRSAPASVEGNTRAPADHPGAAPAAADPPVDDPEAASRAARARAEAAERMAAGDGDGAIAACAAALGTGGEDEAICRLIAAAAHLAAHRFQDAGEMLAPARGRLGVLEPWGALLLGEARAGAGAHEEALALLEEASAADPEGPLARRAEVPAALAMAHAGRLESARSRLQELLRARRGPIPGLRLALARALEAAGDRSGAIELYLRIWREHPDRPEADFAEARLADLRRAGAAAAAPDADAIVERAERWLAVGRSDRALAALEGISIPGREAELALLRARALGGPGATRQADAEKALLPALKEDTPRAIRLQALELAARLAMRRGDVDAALLHLRALEREGSGDASREAAFLAAFFLYDAGRFEDAERAFRAFTSRWKSGRRADEAVWYVGWTLYKQRRWKEAAEAFDALVRRFPKSEAIDAAIYWRGRALEAAGDRAGARRLYREAIRRDPVGWYALLARGRLGDEAPAIALRTERLVAPKQKPKIPAVARARLDRAAALYAAGLVEEAGAELDAAIAGRRDGGLLALAAAIAREAGDHHRAFALGVFRLGGLRRAADLAYPEAFAEAVRDAARRFSVDPHFVWSIMRQESGFRPRVRSPASAVGLMQLLPSTAERIARRLERPPEEAHALEDPRVNVLFGTWYLGALLERFDGSMALAAAAYNAGPDAVARWLEEPARRDLPLDEFVESIPYRETRHYVKRVLANVQTYRLVHGGPPLRLRASLPKAKPGVDF